MGVVEKLDDSSYETQEKAPAIIAIDFFIVLTIIVALIYTYVINNQLLLKILATLLLVTIAIVFLILKSKKEEKVEFDQTRVNKLVLLDNEGESLKEWYIQGITSMLIGKSSVEHEADIDLSDVEYASLISKEHAVLNYSEGSWFIEDFDSENGVGIRKLGERSTNKLSSDKPSEIGFGDVIYIANTRILVK